MDWARAIEINQTALTRIVAALIAMVGLAMEGAGLRLPKPLYYRALRILRPAESAVRRLIVIASRGVMVKPHAVRPMPKGLKLGRNAGTRASFQLFDSRKRFGSMRVRRAGPRIEPRIRVLDFDPRVPLFQPREERRPEPPIDDGMVSAKRLGLRLQAIRMALENLPRQAARLKRWQARRGRMASPKFRSPLRPGPPPGHRKMAEEEVDFVLRECHWLAWEVLKEDSS